MWNVPLIDEWYMQGQIGNGIASGLSKKTASQGNLDETWNQKDIQYHNIYKISIWRKRLSFFHLKTPYVNLSNNYKCTEIGRLMYSKLLLCQKCSFVWTQNLLWRQLVNFWWFFSIFRQIRIFKKNQCPPGLLDFRFFVLMQQVYPDLYRLSYCEFLTYTFEKGRCMSELNIIRDIIL